MVFQRQFAFSLLLVSSSVALAATVNAQPPSPTYDLIIRGGTLYGGSGQPPVVGDVAINGDRIVAVGKVDGRARTELPARGMAIAPGFLNMLRWATESLPADPRTQSALRHGATLEVMRHGWSMGPPHAPTKTAD